MARKSKPLTPLQQEYRKQRRRIQQFIRRAEKRGYQFAENVIPDKVKKITKQSVERLRKLTPEKLYKKAVYGGEASYGEIVKGTKGLELERKAKAEKARETRKARQALRQSIPQQQDIPLDNIFDEDFSQQIEEPKDIYEQRYEERWEEEDKRYERSDDVTLFDRIILDTFYSNYIRMNEPAYKLFDKFYKDVLNRYGGHEVAQMLQSAAEAGVVLTQRDSYHEEKVIAYLNELLDYLPEVGDFTRAQIFEALEYDESYEMPT